MVRAGNLALAQALAAIGLRSCEHPGAEAGMGTRLATGVSAAADAAGWVIALGDMPWARPETIRDLSEALRAGAKLVAPQQAARRGNPVGFAATWGERLRALTGDRGARDLIAARADLLVLVPAEDPGVLLDVDSPADLKARTGESEGPATSGWCQRGAILCRVQVQAEQG